MKADEIARIAEKQRVYFHTGATLPTFRRIEALNRLKQVIHAHEAEIFRALQKDLGKSRTESYMCEVGLTYGEISYMTGHLQSFAAPKRVATPLSQFSAKSYVLPCPYGVTLIMSPWNYPFLLSIEPLVDAIAAGNTAVVKPSAYAPETSKMIEKIVAEAFPPELVTVVTGGREENTCLLNQQFDHIFFTGSQAVGTEVMTKAAAHLTPVTLELGGKSPCIVGKTSNIQLAAKRIVFGKFLNCGQTCVAPDYIYCHESIHDKLVEELKKQIRLQFGSAPLENPNYGKIINKKHFDRVCSLLDPDKCVHGGKADLSGLRLEPTLMDRVTWNDPIMKQEIFGPILPILTYKKLTDVIETLQQKPLPLALYFFTRDKQAARLVTEHCRYGGGCINDVVVHLASSHMGFGGVGASGMGSYHGKAGFDAFSHKKSVLEKRNWLDLPMRYQPYSKIGEKLIRMFLK